ncbi:MAG: Hpt domain-containing protein, partial [Pyrinomonadaceae bacterium]
MDRDNSQSFIKSAESDLASARSSLLVAVQTGDVSDLITPRDAIARLMDGASLNGLTHISDLSGRAIATIESVSKVSPELAKIYSALDLIAQIEAEVWQLPLGSDYFLDDVSGFVDESFGELMPKVGGPVEHSWSDEEFEIDDETLDVFRSEADELLANIARNLDTLASSPGDQSSLWEIRRNAHTFKGASGIVGLSAASSIAHQIEDLLDRMVELRIEASKEVIRFLYRSCARLNSIVGEKIEEKGSLDPEYDAAMASLGSAASPSYRSPSVSIRQATANPSGKSQKTATSPIVRVSLERLDEILSISRNLTETCSKLEETFVESGTSVVLDPPTLSKLEAILREQRSLNADLHAKLLRIRMVKFGTLETRLNRAVHVTCADDHKKANVRLENPDVEVDTQVIDALIEPLLHLLKNAVVHGIEPPDTRRLIGKPE